MFGRASTTSPYSPYPHERGLALTHHVRQEKRFRSMQEHIRRAHPEYYIPKLPATKESFELMVNSPPHERVPRLDVWSPTSAPRQLRQLPSEDQYAVSDPAGLSHEPSFIEFEFPANSYFGQGSGPIQTDGYYPDIISSFPDAYRRGSLLPAANAAAALAQLHYARPDGEFENDQVGMPFGTSAAIAKNLYQNFFADHVPDAKRAHFVDPTLGPDQQFLDSQYQDSKEQTPGLLPSSMTKSPPSRSNTLPPVPRTASRLSRPRKSSLSQSARKAKHERHKANGHFRNTSHERKALSAEPNMYGKRWEDLIDAATSATEEDSRDLTPVRPCSPWLTLIILSFVLIPITRYQSRPSAHRKSNLVLPCRPSPWARSFSPTPRPHCNKPSHHHRQMMLQIHWICIPSPRSKTRPRLRPSTLQPRARIFTSCRLMPLTRHQCSQIPSKSIAPAVEGLAYSRTVLHVQSVYVVSVQPASTPSSPNRIVDA